MAIILLIGVGFFAGQFLNLTRLSVPREHQAIIDNTKIMDAAAHFSFEPKIVDSGTRTYGQGLPSLAVFQQGKHYAQTTVIWQRYGDTEICMTIWGPDDSGNMLQIEVARLGANPFKVIVNDKTMLEIAATNQPPYEGYWVFDMKVD